MANEQSLNIKGLFESNTRVTTLRELEKQGKSRVKVVNTSQIIDLISQAVENVISRRALSLAEQERQTVIRDSNEEFRKLLREREDERRRGNVNQELLENYQREAEQARAQADDLRRQLTHAESTRVDENEHRRTVVSLEEEKIETDKLRREISHLLEELETLKSRCSGADRARIEVEELRRRLTELEKVEVEAIDLRQKKSRLEETSREVDELRRELLETKTQHETEKLDVKREFERRAEELERRLQEERSRHELDQSKGEKLRLELDQNAETIRVHQSQVADLQRDLEAAHRELRTKTSVETEVQAKDSQLRDALAKIQVLEQEAHQRGETVRSQVASAEKRAHEFEGLASTQKDLIQKYETRIDAYEQRIGSYEKRIEDLAGELEQARENGNAQQGAFTSMVQELQSLKSAIETQDRAPNPAQVAAEQSSLTEKLQDLFSKKMESIEQSLSMKLEGLATGSEAGSAVEPDLVLDRLFADGLDTMESNLGTVEVKESQSGDISDQLSRLKSLQGGILGGATSDDESDGDRSAESS